MYTGQQRGEMKKKSSVLLIIREMQMKIPIIYPLSQSEWLFSQSQDITNAGDNVEKDSLVQLVNIQ